MHLPCDAFQTELLAEKEKFATLNGGVPYDPPKVKSSKKKGPAKTPAPDRAPGEKSKKVRTVQTQSETTENKSRVVWGGEECHLSDRDRESVDVEHLG